MEARVDLPLPLVPHSSTTTQRRRSRRLQAHARHATYTNPGGGFPCFPEFEGLKGANSNAIPSEMIYCYDRLLDELWSNLTVYTYNTTQHAIRNV